MARATALLATGVEGLTSNIMQRTRLERRPEARSYSVEALLDLVKQGRLRVPDFQRPLKWGAQDVLDLFDSVYRGFPIGELLLSKAPAPRANLAFGPVLVDSPELQDALHVVDGQQRLTALAGALLHPEERPRGGIYAVWFDLEKETFIRSDRQEPPSHWIPLNVVGDSYQLLQWLNDWPYREQRKDLVKRAIELGKAIREYPIPAYVVDGATEEELRLIFKRTNTAGIQLDESEVFDALFRTEEGKPIESACSRLNMETGFGTLDHDLFLRCLKVVEGLPASTDLAQRTKTLDGGGAVARTEAALRRTLEFLIMDAGIIHGQLLPYRLPLIVLSRFFHLIPTPHPRNRTLLVRWVWRGILSEEHSASSNAVVQKLSASIEASDESISVQHLLASVSRSFLLPDSQTRWNGRAAPARACALALIAQQPRDPETGRPFPREEIQEALAKGDQTKVLVDLASFDGRDGGKVLAYRAVLLNKAKLLGLEPTDTDVLKSHLLDAECLQLLLAANLEAFGHRRGSLMDPALETYFIQQTGGGDTDRPPVSSLVKQVDAALGAA